MAEAAVTASVIAGVERARHMLAAARETLRLGPLDTAVSRADAARLHAADALLRPEDEELRSHAGPKNRFAPALVKTGKRPAELGKIPAGLVNVEDHGRYLAVTATMDRGRRRGLA